MSKYLMIFWLFALPFVITVSSNWRFGGFALTIMIVTLVIEHILIKGYV